MSIITSVDTVHVFLEEDVLREMSSFGESGYPEEVAALMLGHKRGKQVRVRHLLRTENRLGAEARSYSYQISSFDWQRGEREARERAMELVGVFHTHPDHPSEPSLYDLEFALPNFIYVIASIRQGKLSRVQAWQLLEDRSQFSQCALL